MANASAIRRWMKKAARLLDNGDGSYSPLVGVAPGAGTVANNALVAPAANAVIATTGALAAGDYLVSWWGGTDDAAGVNKGLQVQTLAGGWLDFRPCPGQFSGGIARLTLPAGGGVRVQAGAAAGAGSLYVGGVAAYKLS